MNAPDKTHGWRRAGLWLWLFLLTAALLTGRAYANSSLPGYFLTVQVLNCPAEPYWLCLLVPDAETARKYPAEDLPHYEPQPEDLPAELRQAAAEHAPEGWHLSWMDDNAFQHEEGPGSEMRHHVNLLTRKFRLLVLTRSGECWVSPPLRRTVAETYVSVDWAAKTTHTPPAWIAYYFNILSTVLPTLLIEGLVLLLFLYDIRKNWEVFLRVNLATQGFLWVVVGGLSAYSFNMGSLALIVVLLFFAEPVITAIEAINYAKRLVGGTPLRAVLYAVTANAASFFFGLRASFLLWEWCMDTFYRLPRAF